ncbi:unnamed protein product [Effrenium voratum]|uniref:Uncharacterized protein n=1 Tax=Effrenium voratum TaxID=2562239 RepID=A0AA36ND65_9DINO|nr:unnamed protein product [Effrenium voratum]
MRILVVEDDTDLNRQLVTALEEAGYVVDSAADGEEGHFLGETEPYDAVVLDLGLPTLDGLSVLENWRRDGRTMPVLILTARDRWSDKVAGIDAGADDYVAKPFHMEEVLARVRALVRRAAGHASNELICGPVRLDLRAGRVTVDGNPIKLTSHEYRLLSYLLHHRGKVISRTELTEHLYDQDFDRDSNTVEVFVGRLRKKIGASGTVLESPVTTDRDAVAKAQQTGSRQWSLASRLVFVAAVWSTITLALAGVFLVSLYQSASERAFDAQLEVHIKGLIAGMLETGQNGGPETLIQSVAAPVYRGDPRFSLPLSGWYWTVRRADNPSIMFASESLLGDPLNTPPIGDMDSSAGFVSGPTGDEVRVLQQRITIGEASYVIAVGAATAGFWADIAEFSRTVTLTLCIVGIGLILAIFLQVRVGLRPLARLRSSLSAVRLGETERIDEALPREISPLAVELNALIVSNKEIVERARTHVGNLAHGLKTPLSVISNEARASQGPFADKVSEQAAIMSTQIQHHLERARRFPNYDPRCFSVCESQHLAQCPDFSM